MNTLYTNIVKNSLLSTLILFAFCVVLQAQEWNATGEILGKRNYDECGKEVATNYDGSVIAVGAPFFNDNSFSLNDAGHIRIFSFDNNTWQQMGDDLLGEEYDEQGTSFALSDDGKTIVVGLPQDSDNGSRTGKVLVYKYNNSNWDSLGQVIVGDVTHGKMGFDVSISPDGSTIAASAPVPDWQNKKGRVNVFFWDGVSWNQRGQELVGDIEMDKFGYAIKLANDGNTIAISSPKELDGWPRGFVRVFDYDGSAWIQRGEDILGSGDLSYAGHSLDITEDGNTLILGEPGLTTVSSGKAKVFQWVNGEWTQQGSTITGLGDRDYLGFDVEISEDANTISVGAPLLTSTGIWSGGANIYDWDGSDWQLNDLLVLGESDGDQMGYSVSLSGDGRTLVCGGPYNDNMDEDAGMVKVFSNKFTSTSKDIGLGKEQFLFPNPANSFISVQSNELFNTIKLYSVDGRLLKQSQLNQVNALIDINNLPNGLILYTLHNSENVISGKFIKQ